MSYYSHVYKDGMKLFVCGNVSYIYENEKSFYGSVMSGNKNSWKSIHEKEKELKTEFSIIRRYLTKKYHYYIKRIDGYWDELEQQDFYNMYNNQKFSAKMKVLLND